MTDKIQQGHLDRSAYVYIRQSTMQQVRNNTESKRRQYALEGRAKDLGFRNVVIIDEDLGVSGTGSQARTGFAKLLAAVCNGEVGAVFALEASRLARNNRDWHHLIDLCVLTDTVVVDAEGVYDPRLLNDRMLLGLKGTMSEFEIGVLRQRAREAYRQKVQRGEVLTMVPIGYERSSDRRIEMTPDRQIQEALHCFFKRLEALGTLRQVLLWYRAEQITFPRRRWSDGTSSIEWCLPDYQQLIRIVKNPVYAGAFAFGKSRAQTKIVEGRSHKSWSRKVPLEEWQVLMKDHHQGYISWERYMKNLDLLKSNSTRTHITHSGAPRGGSAMLAGLLRCAKCGLKLHVGYRSANGRNGRYQCARGTRQTGKPCCQTFAALRVDRAVEAEVLRACQRFGVEASLQCLGQEKTELEQKRKIIETAVVKARYEVDRARRQYDTVDPANRLVAAELELRWNEALAHLAEVESRSKSVVGEPEPLTPEMRQKIMSLGADLRLLWDNPAAPVELKKRILRTAIREIVVEANEEAGRIELMIHWSGGVHTRLHVTKNRYGQNNRAANDDTVELVRGLAQAWSDKFIARILNQIGSRTGAGNHWSETRVRSFRGEHQIQVYSKACERTWLTIDETAKELQVDARLIRRLVREGKIPSKQFAPGVPYMIERQDLGREEVVSRVREAHCRKSISVADPNQIVMTSI